MSESVATSVRARARAEMTEQIKQKARDHLAVDGPDLSLRAVARDLGLVSSAVYRYFASRDELLTALIIDAYNSLGAAAEDAVTAAGRRDARVRWLALGRGIRRWALDHRPEYALLYGSPVPGYAAPADTIEPANRPVIVLLDLVRDAVDQGAVEVPSDRLPRAIRGDLSEGFREFGYDLPPGLIARAVTAWAQLFGALNFELFGRLTNFIHDYDAWFDVQLEGMAGYLGI